VLSHGTANPHKLYGDGRWKYVIMQTFGHMQIKTPDVVSKIKSLSYPRSQLTVVEVRSTQSSL
jgi:hypothetical protein